MPTQQGDLSLLDDPIAQEMLQSHYPARLAYTWTDGTPRVVPIWFHWNGKEIVLGGPTDAPKMSVLRNGTKVAISIDGDIFPYRALTIRGTIRTDTVEGLSPEYEAAAKRHLGSEQGEAWLEIARSLFPEMSRISVTPEWVGILDFETRFPNAVERRMEQAQAEA